jgi:xanthine dehydrogenase YagS FAD-binding subunit
MRPFTYTSSATVDEVIGLLSGDGMIRPLAGGTDLLTLMKADIAAPSQLVDIKRLADLPAGIEETAAGLTLGALTRLAEIETHPLVQNNARALAEAAALAATPQLRNMATLGGNLLQRPRCWYFRNALVQCWLKGGTECQAADGENQLHALFGASPCVAVHPSDLAPALLALDAVVRLRGASGERTLPLAKLFAEPSEERRTETLLGPDELIVAVQIPRQPGGTRSTYLKAMDRQVWAFALVGVAAALRVDGGQIAEARVVLSGVAPIPWRAEAAERLLVGAAPGEALFAQAAEAALADARPLEHNRYKVPLAKALLRQALAALAAA